MKRLLVGLATGLAGGLAWYAGMLLFFGPAQGVLADPALQSRKFLYVVAELEPLSRTIGQPATLIIGLLIVGMVWGLAFSWFGRALGESTLGRGVRFGALGWCLMVPWFEFYLPWNVMHEPLALVLLEAVLWALVLQLVGVTISVCHAALARRVG